MKPVSHVSLGLKVAFGIYQVSLTRSKWSRHPEAHQFQYATAAIMHLAKKIPFLFFKILQRKAVSKFSINEVFPEVSIIRLDA